MPLVATRMRWGWRCEDGQARLALDTASRNADEVGLALREKIMTDEAEREEVATRMRWGWRCEEI